MSIPSTAPAWFRTASESAIQDCYRSALPTHISRKRWVGHNNRYRVDSVKTIRSDVKANPSQINSRHLSQYIAASAPLHCLDGWDYLGRAIGCAARGDSDVALHLAYYAELRAGMSIMASVGIGVFDQYHFVVESSGSCSVLSGIIGRPHPCPTHEFTWEALKDWASAPGAADLLEQAISPGAIPLGEWLAAFSSSAPRPLASSWLHRWGLDLRLMTEDRAARNEASYRPRHINSSKHADPKYSVQFLYDLWWLCEPSGRARFEPLDRHLLRLSLSQMYKAVTGETVLPGNRAVSRYAGMLDAALAKLVRSGHLRQEQVEGWKSFLTWQTDAQKPILLREAENTYPLNQPHHHLQVAARATLLLRVATGACAHLLSIGALAREDLEFWWKPYAEGRGLWDPSTPPTEITDLWADLRNAMQAASAWAASSGTSFASWLQSEDGMSATLDSSELIGLWGLGL